MHSSEGTILQPLSRRLRLKINKDWKHSTGQTMELIGDRSFSDEYTAALVVVKKGKKTWTGLSTLKCKFTEDDRHEEFS